MPVTVVVGYSASVVPPGGYFPVATWRELSGKPAHAGPIEGIEVKLNLNGPKTKRILIIVR